MFLGSFIWMKFLQIGFSKTNFHKFLNLFYKVSLKKIVATLRFDSQDSFFFLKYFLTCF